MSKRFIFNIGENIRLDDFLRRELPLKVNCNNNHFSNGKIRRLIVAGAVSVNGNAVTRPGFELWGRSKVIVEFDAEKFFYEKQPDDISFSVTDKDVLYEDDNLIFINKPAFFPVEQTITGNRDNLHDAVVSYLKQRNPQLKNPPYAGIMHRLDRETSGVIMFTKTRSVNKTVSDMFQNHSFKKIYTAIVCPDDNFKADDFNNKTDNLKNKASGFLKRNQDNKHNSNNMASGYGVYKPGYHFTVEKYMGRITPKGQPGKWGTLAESKGGQYSKTSFTIVKQCEIEGHKCFVVECDLETGRTHQIRVHLSEAGLPIVGDVLYGGIPYNRLMLHATSLEINNPKLNLNRKIEAPVPF